MSLDSYVSPSLYLVFLFSRRTAFPYAYISLLLFTLGTEIFFIAFESTLADIEIDGERAGNITKTIFQGMI